MAIEVKVNVDLKGIKTLLSALRGGGGEPMQKTLAQWGMIYRSWAQRRYVRYADGQGNWPALSPVTIARRRKGPRAGGKVQILRDTGTMFRVLDPAFAGAPGALQIINPTKFMITVGYGGAGVHPSGRNATVADIASYHQKGNRRLPQRKIIDTPDDATIKQMGDIAAKNLAAVGNGKAVP